MIHYHGLNSNYNCKWKLYAGGSFAHELDKQMDHTILKMELNIFLPTLSSVHSNMFYPVLLISVQSETKQSFIDHLKQGSIPFLLGCLPNISGSLPNS